MCAVPRLIFGSAFSYHNSCGTLAHISARATIGAISWFRVMKKDDLISEINKSAQNRTDLVIKN